MTASKTFRLFLLLSLSLLSAAFADGADNITRMSDGRGVTLFQMAGAAERSDVILVGEVHDNAAHHDLQFALIRSLSWKKVPLAIGVEMMQAESQKDLDDWVAGKTTEKEFEKVFAANWVQEWRLYRDIFVFARDNKIPLIALNLPKDLAKKVSRQGYASLTEEERKTLPAGTTCDLDNPHTEFLKKAFKHLFKNVTKGRIFEYFCEAQTLRNSGMASTMMQYAQKHPGTKIVALTGIWHAVKNAIPDQLQRKGSKLAATVILPEIAELDKSNATAAVADYMVTTR